MEMVKLELDKPVFEKLKASAELAGYKDPYVYLTSLILDKAREQELRGCPHCPVNAKAEKPLLEMTKLSIDGRLHKDLEDTAKKGGERPECFVCDLFTDMIDGFGYQRKA